LKIKIGPPLLGPLNEVRFTTADALIDTGAQRTILAPDVIHRIGLSKIDETTLIRVGGEVRAEVYAASLQFPHSGFGAIEMIAVPSSDLPPLFRCLLGRDVLSRWIFTYDGPGGGWELREEAGSPWVEPPEGIDPNLWGE
jgi:predicted aspartyl protease